MIENFNSTRIRYILNYGTIESNLLKTQLYNYKFLSTKVKGHAKKNKKGVPSILLRP